MESIILIGHGSPKKDANNIDLVGRLLHSAIHPGCAEGCVKAAYLQFSDPDIMTTIKNCVGEGAKRVILHPYFLSSGMHVTKDIPEMVQEAEGLYPGVEFIYTEPLGVHEKLVQIVVERINAAKGSVPLDIERKSFEIIADEAELDRVPAELLPIVKRVVHATADFEFVKTLTFHPEALKAGIEAIKAGKPILTDIEMVRTGISRRLAEKFGIELLCGIADETVAAESERTGKTRSELAIEQYLKKSPGIIAVGNAPTALLKAVELINSPEFQGVPPLVIGVPVGFVNAYESKALLSLQKFPFITNLSRKGGTPVAVAIVNALLKIAAGE